MNWLDQWLAETEEITCPLCPHSLESSTHADSQRDTKHVPDLSPTYPPSVPAPSPENGGQRDNSRCPAVLSPVKPAPVQRLQPLGTEGQKGHFPEDAQRHAHPTLDPTLETLCLGLPIEEAQALREERAGILEHQGGMSKPKAEAAAGLPIRAPPTTFASPP